MGTMTIATRPFLMTCTQCDILCMLYSMAVLEIMYIQYLCKCIQIMNRSRSTERLHGLVPMASGVTDTGLQLATSVQQ